MNDPSVRNASEPPPPGEFAGTARFAVRRRIGEGAFGVVYEALDGERGGVPVALKLLRRPDAADLYRFKREFRALADLTHPNLVSLHELLTDGGRWFFTMELVDGAVDFLSYVRPDGAAHGQSGAGASAPTLAVETFSVPDAAGLARADAARAVTLPAYDLGSHDSGELLGLRGEELARTPTSSVNLSAGEQPTAPAPPNPDDPAASAVVVPASARVPTTLMGVPAQPPAFRDDRLRAALAQLAEGLIALHDAGKLHRDIKPSNVLVTRGGRVVILDFGLVSDLLRDEEEGGGIESRMVGTPEYMSPEQAAGSSTDEATDWYSVGAMLYEALTGKLPFTGSVAEIVADKILRDPPRPDAVAPGVPEDLAALCMDLLRRTPGERAGGRDVLRRLATAQALGTPARAARASGSAPRRRTVALVGRSTHLASLWRAMDDVRGGRTVTVFVRGRSGMGKTVLARRFLDEVRRRAPDVLVLAGQCYEQESVPFKALDALIDALGQYLGEQSPAALEAVLPANTAALARLFPVLRRFEAFAPRDEGAGGAAEIPDAQEVRRRAFGALRALLTRLGDQGPLLLFIDNLQWGDADSAALLDELLALPGAPRLLLVATYRTEDQDSSPFLRSMAGATGAAAGDTRVVDVGELPADEALALARALVRAQGPEAVARAEVIAREAGGNPLFIDALARHAAEVQLAQSAAAGERAGGSESTTTTTTSVTNGGARRPSSPGIVAAASAPRQQAALDEVIWERVTRLDETARTLLEVVAVAGRPVELAIARRAGALADAAPIAALTMLRAEHLLRTRGLREHDEIETYHDRVRESVLARLSPATRRAHHLGLAQALEAAGRSESDPHTLALHYRGAGERDRAAHYTARAAARAASTLAFERAAQLYRAALELRPDRDAEGRALRAGLGDALANAGRGREAAEAFLAAAAGAGELEALTLRSRAIDALLRSGQIDAGVAELRGVLSALGLGFAPSPRRALLALLALRVKLKVRGLSFRERPAREIPARELLAFDTCRVAAQGLALVDTIRGAEFNSRLLAMGLALGEPARVARALAIEAGFSSTEGTRTAARTAHLLERAHALAERVGDPHALGLVYLTRGIAGCLAGRFRAGYHDSRAAARILQERCVAPWDLGQAQFYALASRLWLGEIKPIAQELPALLKVNQERSDLMAQTSLRLYLLPHTLLAADDPSGARREVDDAMARWSQQGFHVQHWWALLARAQCGLYEGRGAATLALLGAERAALERSLMLRVQYAQVEWLELRARAALCAAAAGGWRAPLWLRAAERDARALAATGAPWALGLAQVINAGVAALRRDDEDAMAHYARAEATLEGAEMALHAAAARWQRARLEGGEGGRARRAQAEGAMRAQGVKSPPRVAQMLSPGRA